MDANGNGTTMPNDPDIHSQLRAKIRGKMDVAKFFAGFVSVVFGFAFRVTSFPGSSASTKVAIASAYLTLPLFLCAIAFGLAAMFAYDRLLMPAAYWKSPWSDDALKQAMVNVWSRLFLPAVWSLLLGVLTAAAWITNGAPMAVGLAALALLVAGCAYWFTTHKWVFRPRGESSPDGARG